MELKRINFIAPWHTQKAYELLAECSYSSFRYYQAQMLLEELGYSISLDEYATFNELQHAFMKADPAFNPVSHSYGRK